MLPGFHKTSITSALNLDSVRTRTSGIFWARLPLRPGTGTVSGDGDIHAVGGTDGGDGDIHAGDGVYTREQVREKLDYLLHPKRPLPRPERRGGYQLPLPVDLSVVQCLLREDHYDIVANFNYMNMEEPRRHIEYLLLLLDAVNKEHLVLFVNDSFFFFGMPRLMARPALFRYGCGRH